MRLSEKYVKEIRPKVMKALGIKNVNAVPRFAKVKVNVGIGSYMKNNKDFSNIVENIQAITGQKPVINKSKIAISNFKLRIGMPVGVSVTLRGEKMYDFIDRLINVVLPRVRDFRGISPKSFDQKGNYSFGLKDISVFPELDIEDIAKIHGCQVTVNTSANTEEDGHTLLTEIGFPFKKI